MIDAIVPAWKRPYRVTEDIGDSSAVSVPSLLHRHGYTESARAAKRLAQQPIFWLDDHECPVARMVIFPDLDPVIGWVEFSPTTISERLRQVAIPDTGKLTLYPGDTLCVGKTRDDALCHRIEITGTSEERPTSAETVAYIRRAVDESMAAYTKFVKS